MPFLKMHYIRLSYIRLLYYMENRSIVHRRIKEYCTSLKSGILYITENRSIIHHWNQEYCTSLKKRNFVQHRKQELCTTQKSGILYIADMMRSVNGPHVVAPKSGVCRHQTPSICTIQSRKRWESVQTSLSSLYELNITENLLMTQLNDPRS